MSYSGELLDPSGLRVARSTALARNWWALVLRGIAALIFGAICFLYPVVGLSSIVFVFGIYLLVDGVFDIVGSLRAMAHHERWGLLLLEGIADIVIGLVALAVPVVAVAVWTIILGAWAIVTGALMVAAAFRLHTGHGNWLLGLGGAVSIIWGVLLLVWPLVGAVVLTIWLGAYAIVFGIMMIAFGLRLRARHVAGPAPAY